MILLITTLLSLLIVSQSQAGPAANGVDCHESGAPLDTRKAEDVIAALPHWQNKPNYPALPSRKAGYDKDGNYVTSIGLVFEPSCLGQAREINKISPESAFDNISGTLRNKIERCIERRGLPAVGVTLSKVLASGPRISCGDKSCAKNSEACAFKEQNRINFEKSLQDPALTFHELLHLTGTDNQHYGEHNKHEPLTDLKDQIYFWQKHCFSPMDLLFQARILDGKKPCSEALGHDGRGKKPRYNTREIEFVCRFYDDYMAKEDTFERTVLKHLLPEVFKCDSRAGSPCAGLRAQAEACLDRGVRIGAEFSNCIEKLAEQDQSEAATAYFKKVKALGDVYVSGPGMYGLFPSYADTRFPYPIKITDVACQGDPLLKDTSFCKTYQRQIRGPMLRLLRHWW